MSKSSKITSRFQHVRELNIPKSRTSWLQHVRGMVTNSGLHRQLSQLELSRPIDIKQLTQIKTDGERILAKHEHQIKELEHTKIQAETLLKTISSKVRITIQADQAALMQTIEDAQTATSGTKGYIAALNQSLRHILNKAMFERRAKNKQLLTRKNVLDKAIEELNLVKARQTLLKDELIKAEAHIELLKEFVKEKDRNRMRPGKRLVRWTPSHEKKNISQPSKGRAQTSKVAYVALSVHSRPRLQADFASVLESAFFQWRTGNWASLANMDHAMLMQDSERENIALLAGLAQMQQGHRAEAHELLGLAVKWGASKAAICKALMSSAYEALGRAAVLCEDASCAKRLFNESANHADAIPSPYVTSTALVARLNKLQSVFLDRILEKGKDLELDGIKTIDGKDPFLSGKIMLTAAHLVIGTVPANKRQQYLNQFRYLSELLRDEPVASWGIYFYLLALQKLEYAGLLREALDEKILSMLREKLDWRSFVDPNTYELINKPNNFFGIAYAIAGFRHALGWDGAEHEQKLLGRMIKHYTEGSSRYGFADETEGHGRFDRYSILLIAEIAHRMHELRKPLTLELEVWLRRAAEVVLHNLNENGDGFQFGRSIGAYGDSAFLEVLSAAAWYGVLTTVETRMAHAFSVKATQKFLGFWFDATRGSVNLWDDGRRTDHYRGKHRILGENLSLLHQHFITHRLWVELGYTATPSDLEFANWLNQRPRYTLTRFAENEHQSRAMLTAHDGGRIFSLWLVNGDVYHQQTAYFPTPFSSQLIQAIPDEDVAQLVPRVELADGSTVMPLAFMHRISCIDSASGATLEMKQSGLDLLGETRPKKDDRLAVETRFEFSPGCVKRIDRFMPQQPIDITGISLVFASFSADPIVIGKSVLFASGDIYQLTLGGFAAPVITAIDQSEKYRTPSGQLKSLVECRAPGGLRSEPFEVSWTLLYFPSRNTQQHIY